MTSSSHSNTQGIVPTTTNVMYQPDETIRLEVRMGEETVSQQGQETL